MAIALVGAEVRWLPISKDTLTLDMNILENSLDQIKVILNYNVAGYLSDLQYLENICREKNIIFINDCNNSEFSKFNGPA